MDNLETLKMYLLEAQREILEKGDAQCAPNRVDPTQVPDEDTQPLNEMAQVLASSQNQRRIKELKHIQDALARLEQDPEDFGICEDCDKPIPLGRMKIKPWARFCVACLQAKEHPHQSSRRRHMFDFID